MQPLIFSANFTAAEITRSYGVTPISVMYLCLWKTLAKILVSLVSFIHIIHDR